MHVFELKNPTRATITSVTPRLEKHGEDNVRAVSFGIKISASNTLLDLLSAGLLAALYTKPDNETPGPRTFEGMELSHLPLLRTSGVESLNVKGSYEGWTLHIPYGIDDTSAINLGGCKVDKFKVIPIEGGSITLTMRIGTSAVDEPLCGKLMMLLGEEREITLLAPAKPADTIDGTGAEFLKDHPGAAGQAQPDLLDAAPPKQVEPGAALAEAVKAATDTKDWPFPQGDGPAPEADAAAAGGQEAAAPAPAPAPAKRSGRRAAVPQ